MKVPFLDVGAATAELREELAGAVLRVVDSGWYVRGEEVAAFERSWAAYLGVAHAVGVNSGLDALSLALRAVGVRPGDEVIVPTNTFVATWLAVTYVGAVPVPVEPDEATFNLDPQGVDAAVTKRTRAVVPVHLYGRPADMEELTAVARAHDLVVVEDAAQAHGARSGQRSAGTAGDVAAWSFYPGKNLGALGDGGAVTTDDEDVANRVRLMGNYGSAEKYVHESAGVNSRLDELQAAVLSVKLRVLDQWNDRRRTVARRYLDGLAGLPLRLPDGDVDAAAWHLFVARSPRRDDLRRHLEAAGVGTQIHYPTPPHRQPAYAADRLGPFPVAEAMADEVLSLPIGPHLSDDQVDAVLDAVRSFHE